MTPHVDKIVKFFPYEMVAIHQPIKSELTCRSNWFKHTFLLKIQNSNIMNTSNISNKEIIVIIMLLLIIITSVFVAGNYRPKTELEDVSPNVLELLDEAYYASF